MEKIDIAQLKGWIGRTTKAEDTVTERLDECFRAVFDPHLARVEAGEAPLGPDNPIAAPNVGRGRGA